MNIRPSDTTIHTSISSNGECSTDLLTAQPGDECSLPTFHFHATIQLLTMGSAQGYHLVTETVDVHFDTGDPQAYVFV
jgi:hypothetical protein